ncbi:ABC transporter substrate-binding protein [Pseudaminobacter soli (ex Li et al. 2025)]|nr:ABC transporter substrate-binding protein [Mesorhizobium soli]
MTQPTLSRRGFLASGTALTALAMGGFLPPIARAQPEKVLRLRMDGDIKILDPGYMIGGIEIEAQKQCLPFLAQYKRDGDTIGWEPTYYVSKLEQRDPTHIDFELVEGLNWSGGHGPLKASDVKFSYERMKKSEWAGYFEVLDHVEVTGERTGTIVLTKPFAPFFLVTLCHGPGAILCERAVTEAGGRFTTQFPAVCGPYLFSNAPGQAATFLPNPDWSGPKPEFDRVQAKIITQVKATELAYEAGELDCTQIDSDAVARYRAGPPPGSELTKAGELNFMWLGMNSEHPKLHDIRVRRAIQHAVDVDSIIAAAYSNVATKSCGIICPGLIGHRTETKFYTYDPAKARELLAEAGVNGLKLSLRTLNTQQPMLVAQIVQANLGAVGITLEVIPLDAGPFWEMGMESAGDTWKDLELWTMRFGSVPDPYEASQWFVSSQVGNWNWERWTNPEYDSLVEQGIAESNPEKRNDIYLRLQEIMEETGAYVWLCHEPRYYVHRSDISVNVSPSGQQDYRLFTVI